MEMKRNTKRTHKDLVEACLTELRSRGWKAWEINVSALASGHHVGRPGMADIYATKGRRITCGRGLTLTYSEVVWVECKIPPDKQSLVQKDFESAVKAEFNSYFVVRSAYELSNFLDSLTPLLLDGFKSCLISRPSLNRTSKHSGRIMRILGE